MAVVDLSNLLPNNRKTLNPFGAVAGNREAPAPAMPASSVPYAPTEHRTPDDVQARIDALSAQNQPKGLPSFTVPDQYANLNPVRTAIPQAPVQSPTTVPAPYSPDVYGQQAQTTFVRTSEPSGPSVIKTAKERAKYSILQAYLNDPRQDQQSKQAISDALQSGTSPDEFVTALRSNGYVPQVDENSLAEAEQISKSMFKDEGEAFKRLVNEGMSVDDAHSTINQRWNEALGQTTEEENAQLEKLREDGVSAASAIKNIQKRRIDEKWANEHPFKNFAEGVLDVGAGAASLAMEQVGNVAGFLGSDYGQQFAQETKEATAETGLAGGTGYQTGRNILGLGESVAAAPASWATEAGMAKTLAGRAGQGAVIGAYQGAAEPILDKGANVTAEEIATGGAMGAGMGAVAVPVLEKGIQYAGTALSKGAREAGKELAGDVTGMFKKTPEVPVSGETAVEGAATPSEMAAVEKVEGKTAKAVFNGKEVEIPQPKTGIGEFVTSPFREKDTKVLAGRAIAPRSVGVNKNPKQKAKLLANTEKDAIEFHAQIRSGELTGEIETLEDTAQTIMKNLDEVGDKIGKAIDGLGDNVPPKSSGLLDDTLSKIDDVLADEIQSDAAAFSVLQKFRQRVDQAKTWKQVQAVKKNYQAELNKLLRNNEAGTEAYAALQKGVQDLTKSIEDAVSLHLPDAQYGKLKSQYALLKRLAGDVAQSALVESRRAPQTLVEQLSYLDALTNPLSFAKQQLVKEVAELNTRGGSWKELVKILDKRGIERAKNFKPAVVPETPAKPVKTEISQVSGAKKPPEEPPTPPKGGEGGQKVPKVPGKPTAPVVSIAKEIEKAGGPKVPQKPASKQSQKAKKAAEIIQGKPRNEKASGSAPKVQEIFADQKSNNATKTQESSVKTATDKADSISLAEKLSDLKTFPASRAEIMAEKQGVRLGDVNKALVERGYVLKSGLGGDNWVKTETAGKFKGKEGIFAGIKAKNAPKSDYTGWTKESGGKLQFEIDDSTASTLGLKKSESKDFFQMVRDSFEMNELANSTRGGIFKTARDANRYAKLETSVGQAMMKTTADGRTFEDVLSDLFSGNKTLGDVLDHPELYRQYPELKDMKFFLNEMVSKDGTRVHSTKGAAFYSSGDDEWPEAIAVNLKTILKEYEDARHYEGANAFERFKMSLIHEIQHAVQKREGFATGASPSTALEAKDEAVAETLKKARGLFAKLRELNEVQESPGVQAIMDKRSELEWDAMAEADVAKKEAKIKELEAFTEKNSDVIKKYRETAEEIRNTRNELLKANKRAAVLDKMDQYDAYYSHGGEVQSRNVEKRMKMSMKERLANSPESTESVPREFQISKKAEGSMESITLPGKEEQSSRSLYLKARDMFTSIDSMDSEYALKELEKNDRRVGKMDAAEKKFVLENAKKYLETVKEDTWRPGKKTFVVKDFNEFMRKATKYDEEVYRSISEKSGQKAVIYRAGELDKNKHGGAFFSENETIPRELYEQGERPVNRTEIEVPPKEQIATYRSQLDAYLDLVNGNKWPVVKYMKEGHSMHEAYNHLRYSYPELFRGYNSPDFLSNFNQKIDKEVSAALKKKGVKLLEYTNPEDIFAQRGLEGSEFQVIDPKIIKGNEVLESSKSIAQRRALEEFKGKKHVTSDEITKFSDDSGLFEMYVTKGLEEAGYEPVKDPVKTYRIIGYDAPKPGLSGLKKPGVMSSELPSESKNLVEDAKRELKRLGRDASFMDLPDSQFKEQFGISKSESAKMILKNRPSVFRPDERQSLYNGNTEKTARERFDISVLEKIGSGSDRDVYQLPDGNVLKIAKTARGLGQNSIAGDYVLDGTVIPHAIEFGDNYVVFEKVTTYKNATPSEKKYLNAFMDDMSRVYSLVNGKRNYDYGKVSEILEKYGWEELMNYDLQDFGFNDVRKANIGIKDGKPILLDEGTVNLVSTIDRYKGVKNLQDPEFRDVYGRSKDAKKKFGDTDPNTMYSVQDKKGLSGLRISSSELPPASPAQELSDAFEKAKDVVKFYQSKDFRKFEQMADEMVQSLPGNTGDMTPEQVKTFRQWNALKNKIRDVYSAVSEQSAKDRSYARDLRADGTEGDLVALHNLGIDKIKKIRELGGLPGPSIGITKKSIPFEDFGDITLVGNRELVESLDAATYDADIYSPRVPSHTLVDKPQYRTNEARKALEERLAKAEKKYPWRKTSVWNVVEGARESDTRNLDAQLLFASENGIKVEPVSQAVKEGVSVDVRETALKILDQFEKKGLSEKFERFYSEIADEFFDKKLFKGFTYSGGKKFEDYTMDNIIREMFKSGAKGTESGQFSGNLSQTLGKNAKKLGLEGIRKMKFAKLDSEYSKLKERWNSVVGWKYSGPVDVEFNPSKSAEWNAKAIGKGFTEEDAQELLDIYKEARKLPRSYIETKFKRAVKLSEFKAVIAPKDKVKELKELLKGTGLEDRIVSYDPATEKRNSKLDSVRKKFGSIFFSQGGALIPAAYVMNEAMKQNGQGGGR